MKVLWFTNTPSCFRCRSNDYNGGGWISSLENEIVNRFPDIKLGICFYYNHKEDEEHCGNVTYFPILRPKKSLLYAAKQVVKDKKTSSFEHEKIAIPSLLNVVEDYKPDIIHIFGSENIFGLLSHYTNIPIVLHIQGILSPCLNAFLPPSISWFDWLFDSPNIKSVLRHFSEKIAWERNSITEQRMMRNIKHFMGRTEWDKRISAVLNPQARYYHCDEILRDDFYKTEKKRALPAKTTLITTISAFLHKGYDVILKTAKILKDSIGIDFEWKIYGDVCTTLAERKTGLSPQAVNVKLMGCASADEIKEAILHATAYVHTAYIENSPNAICEAQLLGCACISTNVGGVDSLIENNKTGILVPANDIYQLAHQIAFLSHETSVNLSLGEAAQEVARIRHNKTAIVNRVMEIYQDISKHANNGL
ncbi:MAG: glycosyltransferase [Bacteroidaceae bacterium]|nr:glycosyltransferase [Bacteroidaceae bacterium]